MKKMFVWFGFLVLLVSCPRVEVDYIGYSDFILRNNSADTIYYAYEITSNFPELHEKTGDISPGQKLTLFSKVSGFNGSPSPVDVFTRCMFYADPDCTQNIYAQDPIDNNEWTWTDITGPHDFSYFEYCLSFE